MGEGKRARASLADESPYFAIDKADNQLATQEQLEHVHRCPQCGNLVKGEDIPYQSIASGVMTCPKCEFAGQINIQIVPTQAKAD